VNCFRCGAAIPEGSRFCASCGTIAVDPHDATLLVETEHPEALFQRVRMVLAGEYDVERELARGGMGVIFKATEVGLRRAVALKVLPPELGLSVKVAERFKREARMVAELDHPNIIPVYRIGQVGGIFFIAMKFIEGRSLGLMIDTQGALPVPVALQVLRGATRALAYAHDRHIIHRDIKGGNILVDHEGRVLVATADGPRPSFLRAGPSLVFLGDGLFAAASAAAPGSPDTILIFERDDDELRLLQEIEAPGAVRALATTLREGTARLLAAVESGERVTIVPFLIRRVTP